MLGGRPVETVHGIMQAIHNNASELAGIPLFQTRSSFIILPFFAYYISMLIIFAQDTSDAPCNSNLSQVQSLNFVVTSVGQQLCGQLWH